MKWKNFLPAFFTLQILLVGMSPAVKAQDTFSILAFDSITREVGAAGASCVDLFNFPTFANDFICELFPDTGAIACQASYIPNNQANARARMRAGDTPTALAQWLFINDAGGTPGVRQYGMIRMDVNGESRTHAFTGNSCIDYKNHIIGPNYTIHGNILLGQQVLDSMEARFLREPGDLACKLMAAMQGANMVGADTRCAPNNSSSLFAFLKVSRPTDTFGNPSLLLSLKTHSNDKIEPIDSLQKLFNAARTCTVNTTALREDPEEMFSVYPNPSRNGFTILLKSSPSAWQLELINAIGQSVIKDHFTGSSYEIKNIPMHGTYVLLISNESGTYRKKLILSQN